MVELDGTLVDTAAEIAAAANAALAEHGLPPIGESQARRWQPDEKLRRAFEWHYASISGRRSAPRPEALQALRELRALRLRIALVTNKETRFTAPLLHAHDLWQWFDAVICGDMVKRRKPDPLAVEHCLARFRIPARRALLVGDADVDTATARNAGVAFLPSLKEALWLLSPCASS
jgi:phosphoglycolate phosphatase